MGKHRAHKGPLLQSKSRASHTFSYSISGQKLNGSRLDDKTYERISERDMDRLHEGLENLCEEFGEEGWEVEYSVSRYYLLGCSEEETLMRLFHEIVDLS